MGLLCCDSEDDILFLSVVVVVGGARASQGEKEKDKDIRRRLRENVCYGLRVRWRRKKRREGVGREKEWPFKEERRRQ